MTTEYFGALKRKIDESIPGEVGMSNDKKARTEFGPSRSLYLGNLPATVHFHDICNVALDFGPIEFVKLHLNKGTAFLNFVKEESATAFWTHAQSNPLMFHGIQSRVGWAKSTSIAPEIVEAIQQGATRCLFVGGLSNNINEDALVNLFSRFGELENVVVIPSKFHGFVNYASIRAALHAKKEMDNFLLPATGRAIKVNFAKETKSKRPPPAILQATASVAMPGAMGTPGLSMLGLGRSPMGAPPTAPGLSMIPQMMPGVAAAPMSRSLYIGGVAPDVSYHELCKIANRFGAVESASINPQKQCAFLNFVDSNSAGAMFSYSQQSPITIKGQQTKIGWAKASPVSADLMAAIQQGATRNLWVGAVDGQPLGLTEVQLREFFQQFGEFDSIMIKGNIAFVNLTSVKAAVTARNTLNGKNFMENRQLKVNFAKEGTTANQLAAKKKQQRTQGDRKEGEMTGPDSTGTPGRSIYIGNLPDEASVHDLCRLANQFGSLDQVRIKRERYCAFINFVDAETAMALYNAASNAPLYIRGQLVKVSWGKSRDLSEKAIEQIKAGATRNLYVGGVSQALTEQHLNDLFAPYGDIDNIVLKREKHIAFVNMASIASAIKAKTALNNLNIGGVSLKINFAKEATPQTAASRTTPALTTPVLTTQ